MISPQLGLSLHDEIFIDNFAGGGGASTGIERGLRRPVDEALNHDRKALAMHRMNHPTTKHHNEDIRHADPLKIAGQRRVGGIWFSPDCKHFSKAKGGKPRNKKIRGLAWSVLHWGIMALLPDDAVHWEYGPYADTLEDALRFLVEHLSNAEVTRPSERTRSEAK